MKTSKSGAKFSAIVRIGEELREESRKTGKEFLYLNRGINQVENIDLSKIIPMIDFNSDTIQYYPHSKGMLSLRKAINEEFFAGKTSNDNIFITSGGMNSLSLVFQTLNIKKVYTHSLYWGAYTNALKIAGKKQLFYEGFKELKANYKNYNNSAVIICDPNNPTGSKVDDKELFELLGLLAKQNTIVIWDGPYRRLFYDKTDTLYENLLNYDNVIITESFSKSIGLSGQRIGFMYCRDTNFNNEFAVRLLYSGNGVNAFAQILVEKILTTPEGKKAATDFKIKTTKDIKENIKLLQKKKILAEEFYSNKTPVGIFVIVNKSFDELKSKKIGSVPLNYFTKRTDIDVGKYSRICVSAPKEKFVSFFNKL
ncbi:MAG: pyridoxal phosphate-dependent aminotransferase [Bacteroidales bacterium]|nr:pyridoxal phosphate-dependent aminotransferase [Bacteroidales bacterium]